MCGPWAYVYIHVTLSKERVSSRKFPNSYMVSDGRLIPDLPRGRSRLVGGDLDVGEESSEQTIVTLQSLHHGSVDYQHAHTRVGITKKVKFLQMQPRTQARIMKNTTEL
jgi:hypothetical protein